MEQALTVFHANKNTIYQGQAASHVILFMLNALIALREEPAMNAVVQVTGFLTMELVNVHQDFSKMGRYVWHVQLLTLHVLYAHLLVELGNVYRVYLVILLRVLIV
jgi:hypothetical protein